MTQFRNFAGPAWVLFLTTVGQSAAADIQISLMEAQAALEAAQGTAAVVECRAEAFTRVGTVRATESIAHFTMSCHESTDNWTATVELETGRTMWMTCAMSRTLDAGVGPRCLNKLDGWE